MCVCVCVCLPFRALFGFGIDHGGLDDTMQSALDEVVGPSSHQVAGVDDDGAFDRCCGHESAGWRADFEAAATILEKKSDCAELLALEHYSLLSVRVKSGVIHHSVPQPSSSRSFY